LDAVEIFLHNETFGLFVRYSVETPV
jgi:hypothetical protein